MRSYVSVNETIGECDSDSIQRAVDLAAERGIGKVVIPRINERTGESKWIITKTVKLPSDMTVVLDNCFMQMADGVVGGFFASDNLFTERSTKLSERMHNITIVGEGHAVLDGGKPTELNEGTQKALGVPVRLNTPIFFINVEGFSVQNISITNQRYWGMRFEFCSQGIIRDIFFNVTRDRRNQDGINLRNGCHDILIENVFGQTGDDMIALSAIDTGRKIGFEIDYPLIVDGHDWDIHDVTIRNISGAAIRHPLVARRNHNGAKIYNILIENIRDTEKIGEVVVDDLERYAIIAIGGNSYAGIRFAEMGDTSDITVRDVIVRNSVRVLALQSVIKNLTVSNVRAYGPCRSVISTGQDGWASSKSGVKVEGITLSDVCFEPENKEKAKLFDFGCMRQGDYLKNVYADNINLKNVGTLVALDEICDVSDITFGRLRFGDSDIKERVRVHHYDDLPTDLLDGYWLVDGKKTHESDM